MTICRTGSSSCHLNEPGGHAMVQVKGRVAVAGSGRQCP